ncbi:duodenase-1-like isoform X2 [Cebidichthys violaceus]|uniref:duodenase-1-like isoform X2 n=1 Tax=Cebidichthys violaceus TaxID=271503 RepID=UPI0035CB3234
MHPLHKCLLFHLLVYLGQNDGSEIINGELAPENSMQYMASLQDSDGDHVCGGFLIREDFVLTAAHCYVNITHVVLGTHNLKSVNNDNKISIKKKYKHKRFNNEELDNDIMLLKLSTKVSLNRKVQTIPLPTSEMNKEENCQVAGWGDIDNDGTTVDDLRVVNVSIINLEVCKKEWVDLPANVICAGGDETKKGFCSGDSGGPLVCNGKAVGIVSFNTENCDYPDAPNVYTDVSKYLTWINRKLKRYE